MLYATLALCAVFLGWLVVRYDLHQREPLGLMALALALGALGMHLAGCAQLRVIAWMHGRGQIVSNGEYVPLPQTKAQARVDRNILAHAESAGRAAGMDRRSFLKTSAGLAASFLAMNEVFGDYFLVDSAEARDVPTAAAWRKKYAAQFIVDVQLHFVRDDYAWEGILSLGEYAKKWNKALAKVMVEGGWLQ